MLNVYKKGKQLIEEIKNTELPNGSVALWNLGNAGVLIKGVSTSSTKSFPTLVIDPYLTRSIEENNPATEFIREYDAPIRPEDLAGVNVVLLTHQHDDHMDLSTLKALYEVAPETRFVLPAPHADILRESGIPDNAMILACDGKTEIINDIDILPVASAHVNYETDENGNHLYLGYCISLCGVRLYHSGDTLVTNTLIETVRNFAPHIAMLPINGGDYYRNKRDIIGNMTAREAADCAADIKADILLPNHYDMFPNNRDNPAFLVDYLFTHHRTLKFHMTAVGERFIYFAV